MIKVDAAALIFEIFLERLHYIIFAREFNVRRIFGLENAQMNQLNFDVERVIKLKKLQ